jgi:hypothetical protein
MTTPVDLFLPIKYTRLPMALYFFTTLALYIAHNPRANPTIASYTASVVNFYNATGSLTRFENKNFIFYF